MEHDETHGWAWNAIGFENTEYLLENIQKSLQNGTLLENMIIDNKDHKLFYIVYPNNNPVQICLLIKSNENSNNLESFYPLVEGIENELTIIDEYKWENELEGEIIADFKDIVEISFFSPFFSKEFSEYKNKKVKVSLAGIADGIEIADDNETIISEGPFFESQLNEFLNENPDKNKDDFEPMKLSMKGASVFLPTEYSSYYQFRSTVQSIEAVFFLNIELVKLKICLVRPANNDLNIFIYTTKNKINSKDLKIGDDIQGIVMLRGYIDYKFE